MSDWIDDSVREHLNDTKITQPERVVFVNVTRSRSVNSRLNSHRC